MWYKNIAGRFFGSVRKHACDRRTDGWADRRRDGQNYDSQDHASIAASRGKNQTERVQALADISRSALCCHSNATRAPIANPPNSAELECTSYHSPKLRPGPCSSLSGNAARDRQTDTQTRTQTLVINIHFASSTTHVKCNDNNNVIKKMND